MLDFSTPLLIKKPKLQIYLPANHFITLSSMDYENDGNLDFFSLIGIPAPSSTDSSTNRENSLNQESQSEIVER